MATINDKWDMIDALRNSCPNNGECDYLDIECSHCDEACRLHEELTSLV